MKSSEFYKKQFLSGNLKEYDNKYRRDKSLIDDALENYLLSTLKNKISKNDKVLEVGFFSKRISKKLKKYFTKIFSTEHSEAMLDSHNPDQLLFDWVNNKIDKNLTLIGPFDYTISIGHQLSFSCNIRRGLFEFSKLTKKGGILIFDVWNKNLDNSFDPTYEIQKMDIENVINLVQNSGFKLVHISYGQTIYYLFPKLFYRLYSFKIFQKIFFKLIIYFEKWLLKNKICLGNPQTIYCVAKKII